MNTTSASSPRLFASLRSIKTSACYGAVFFFTVVLSACGGSGGEGIDTSSTPESTANTLGNASLQGTGKETLAEIIPKTGETPAKDNSRTTLKGLPPAGSQLAASYGVWMPNPDHPDTCTKEQHDQFWVTGPDGKIYPTWHPPTLTDEVTGKTCYFGHEHGDDPKQGPYPNQAVPFGYVNEMYALDNPTAPRHEDHVGHKIQWERGIRVSYDNNPKGQLLAVCDAQIKLHQGTHSRDALTNNMHELFYSASCSHGIEIHWKVMGLFGSPGVFSKNASCGHGEIKNVGPATPVNSPINEGSRSFGHRECVEKAVLVALNEKSNYAPLNDEFWSTRYSASLGDSLRIHFNPYLKVQNPSRYFDDKQAGLISRNIDLCYLEGDLMARGGICEEMRKLAPKGMAWDDPRSYWKGTKRRYDPNRLIVRNRGQATIYTDALGRRLSYTPFRNSIEQYAKGDQPEIIGDLFMKERDYNAPGIRGFN